jgi:hypothetical protein
MVAVPRNLVVDEGEPTVSAGEVSALVERLSASLDLGPTAAAVSDEGRVWTGWDRVSVWWRRGRRWELLTISGQTVLAPRAPTTVRLRALLDRVATTDQAWIYDRAAPPTLKEQQAELVADYLAVAAPWRIEIHPLTMLGPHGDDTIAGGIPRRAAPVFAGLIFEDFSARPVDQDRQARTGWLVTHGRLALWRARTFSRIWLRDLWLACGDGWSRLTTSRVLGLALLLSVLLAAGCWLTTTTAIQSIPATGTVRPQARQRIYAPADAEVRTLFVTGEEQVTAGQALLTLWDANLESELVAARGKLAEGEQTLQGTKAELHEVSRTGGERAELARLQTRLTQLQIDVEGQRRRIELLEAEGARLTIVAPDAGRVLTTNPRERLDQRPVRRGDLLLELADETSPWQLELMVTEREFGKFRRGTTPVDPADCVIEYRETAEPQVVHQARVVSIASRTEVDPELGPCLRILASVDNPAPFAGRVGASIEARFQGPRVSLFELVLGDAVDLWHRWAWW